MITKLNISLLSAPRDPTEAFLLHQSTVKSGPPESARQLRENFPKKWQKRPEIQAILSK
jgi:hypothetical protein